jgi:ech hydrogenase subunit D
MLEAETQTIETISVDGLLTEVHSLQLDGWRLVQILCIAQPDAYELTYSFGGGFALRSLRFTVGAKQPVPSITPHYPAAFLYENEIRDLFGVKLERIDLDWRGKVYDVEGDRPFAKAGLQLGSSERQTAAVVRPAAGEGQA